MHYAVGLRGLWASRRASRAGWITQSLFWESKKMKRVSKILTQRYSFLTTNKLAERNKFVPKSNQI